MTKPRTLPNRWNLPDLGLGVGLRTRHFKYITEHWPAIIGVTLIVVTVVLPQGLSGLAEKLRARRGKGRP